jgi:anti-sigma B factor antagonist
MNIITETSNEIYNLKIEGEVDASSAIILDEEFSKALSSEKNKILVDCEQLTYISSAGLGVFMANVEECEEKGSKFVLCNLTPKIQSVFNMLGLNHLIQIKNTKEEALVYLNG